MRVLLGPLTAIAATVIYVELRRVKGEPLPQESAGASEAATIPQGRIPDPPETPAGPDARRAAGAPGPEAPSA